MKSQIINTSLFLICCCLPFVTCKKSESAEDILKKLQNLEDVQVTELEATDHFIRLFELRIIQPLDHKQPNGLTFEQKVFLGHIDENLPVAFETEGYSRSNNKTRELSSLMNFNQLAVEHRYYGESKPQPLDWQYLTIWQAANDHHRIVELFKTIYPTAWVSSGASKGGNTALFHRRFFPEDVEATVAYVTPLLFEKEDTRYLDFYESVGDEACREKIKVYQRKMLENVDAFGSLFVNYVQQVNSTYNTNLTFSIPFKDIIYHSMREDYPFEFWSSDVLTCSDIPDRNVSLEDLFGHYVASLDVFLFFSDYGIDFWTPYAYQAATELGSYAFNTNYLSDLEIDIPPFVSFEKLPDFNPQIMQDVQNWINEVGEEIILIYGANDPWTVAAIDYSGTKEVLTFVNPTTKHTTRIGDLSTADQREIQEKLKLWMNF